MIQHQPLQEVPDLENHRGRPPIWSIRSVDRFLDPEKTMKHLACFVLRRKSLPGSEVMSLWVALGCDGLFAGTHDRRRRVTARHDICLVTGESKCNLWFQVTVYPPVRLESAPNSFALKIISGHFGDDNLIGHLCNQVPCDTAALSKSLIVCLSCLSFVCPFVRWFASLCPLSLFAFWFGYCQLACWLAPFSLAFAFVCLQLTLPESQSDDKFLVRFAILKIHGYSNSMFFCFLASWHLALIHFCNPLSLLTSPIDVDCNNCRMQAWQRDMPPEVLLELKVDVLVTASATGLGSGVAECARFWAKFHSSLWKIQRINWNQCSQCFCCKPSRSLSLSRLATVIPASSTPRGGNFITCLGKNQNEIWLPWKIIWKCCTAALFCKANISQFALDAACAALPGRLFHCFRSASFCICMHVQPIPESVCFRSAWIVSRSVRTCWYLMSRGDASATDTLWTESSRQSSCLGYFLVDLQIVFLADVRRVCFDRFSACSSSASFCMASEATAL